tara:strand:+ start:853 stop:1992 length:1140 start_codon:yes stop_codon:yes gene_type:complete
MDLFNTFINLSKEVIQKGVMGMSLIEIGYLLIFVIIALTFRGLFAKFVLKKIIKLVKKTNSKVDDHLFNALLAPLKFIPIVFIFLFITFFIDIQSNLGLSIQKINKTLITILIFWLIHQSFSPLSNLFKNLENIFSKALILWISKSLKYLVVFLGIVAVLDIWGIKIGPIIAGLGLIGVAVALGAQDLFKNLISGILIILERSFEIGDIIQIPGQAAGVVEHIGFRSTKIRKFDSTEVSIPNYLFSDNSIINFSNRKHRRIYWVIGLEYRTSSDQLKKITNEIREFISRKNEFIVNENFKCLVILEKFSDSAIDILISCFTKSNDWEQFLETKQELALEIKKIVEANKAGFAFPSTSIYLEKNDLTNNFLKNISDHNKS